MNQYVELKNSNIFFDIEQKIDMTLIKEGCHICNIPYVGGGIFFIDTSKQKHLYNYVGQVISNTENELNLLKQQIEKQLYVRDYVIIYTRLNKYHPRYVYYNAVAIATSNINDFKKVMKIHKMKAFL